MELSQVRYFIALCGTLNFTRAAMHCNVTQPAFTRAIQRLEEELGGQLILRERGLTQLTPLGREMRPHLTAMIESADAATGLAQQRRAAPVASLRIGLGPGIGAAAIAPAVREVARMLPDLAVHFEESGPAAMIEDMLTDRLDCALIPQGCPLHERLNRWPLYKETAVIALPLDHYLANQNRVTAGDIMNETILAGDRCGGFAQELVTSTCASFATRRCDGAAAQMLEMVAAGLGIALLSNRLPTGGYVVIRPFQDPELSREILLTAVAGRPMNIAAASFIRLCRVMPFH